MGTLRRRSLLNGLTAALFCCSMVGSMAMVRAQREADKLGQVGVIHSNDFKHLWAGARILALGHDPYDPNELLRFAKLQQWKSVNPFVYLPTTAVMLRPVSSMPFESAIVFWFVLNWGAAWALALAGPGLLGVSRPDLARFVASIFLAGAMPFLRQMTAGQMNVVTAWIILGAAAMLMRRRERWAGALLAAGFAWKIAPALLIAALAPMRRLRGFWTGVGTCLLLLALSLPFAGIDIQRHALRVVSQMGYGQSTWSAAGQDFYRDPFNQSPNALIHHLITENPHTTPWISVSPAAANAMTMLASLMIISAWVFTWWKNRRRLEEQFVSTTLFIAASIAMLLLPSLLWDHYAVQALPALIWIAGDARTAKEWRRAIGMLVLIALLSLPWQHTAAVNQSGAGILLMSLRLWPLLALYGWLLLDCNRREAHAHA